MTMPTWDEAKEIHEGLQDPESWQRKGGHVFTISGLCFCARCYSNPIQGKDWGECSGVGGLYPDVDGELNPTVRRMIGTAE